MDKHNLKARGAAFSLPNLTQVEEGTGGTGVALCTCGWYSETLSSGRARKAAHKDHKAQRELIQDSDLPPEPIEEEDEETWDATEEELASAKLRHPSSQEPEGSVTIEVEYIKPETMDILTGAVVTEARSWHGNYSIVMAPMVAELAAAYSEDLKVEQKNVSAMLRHTYITGPRQTVLDFLVGLDVTAEQALAELKVWQKEHLAERRGLTDMQKYDQHRDFLRNFGREAARALKASR